mmetsp:Transcript_48516/g.135608  ORF Transcript_48516/g.135608 Transcript_48516/m.135608 type:complete len:189 (-) Transcript_48516:381-947(-)
MAKPTSDVDLSGFGLERIQHIGRGQYASAQLVRETATGSTYVAKCISLVALNEHDQDLAHQEVFLLQTLAHPYIVSYRDSFLIEGTNTLVIVMEYCDGGDLRKAIKDKAKKVRALLRGRNHELVRAAVLGIAVHPLREGAPPRFEDFEYLPHRRWLCHQAWRFRDFPSAGGHHGGRGHHRRHALLHEP